MARSFARHYLVAGVILFFLGAWLMTLCSAFGATSAELDFFRYTRGTVMIFFGLIPVLFVAVGYGLLPVVAQVPRFFLDRFALAFFYLCVVVLGMSLASRSPLLLNVAMQLNLIFGIVAAIGLILRFGSASRTGTKPSPLLATTIACVGIASFILTDFVLLEFAALQQFLTAIAAGEIPVNYEGHQDLPAIPVPWRHVIWFMGHPEVVVLLFLIGGLLADGLRFAFFRRAAA